MAISLRLKRRRQNEIRTTLHEFKVGKLRSSSGALVGNRKQAIAIALRQAGVPRIGKANLTMLATESVTILAKFVESEHPRARGGEFAPKGRASRNPLHGRDRGAAPSLRQAPLSIPENGPRRSLTHGEAWQRRPSGPADYAALGRSHSAAVHNLSAFARTYDPKNIKQVAALDRLQRRADNLSDQLGLAAPTESPGENGNRSFTHQIPKAVGHDAHMKLVGRMANTVRQAMRDAIEKGHARHLVPADAHPSTVRRAYKHAAMTAMHRAGVINYGFSMSPEEKVEFKPLEGFMRYAQRRLFDRFHTENPGAFAHHKAEFGTPFADNRTDQSGAIRLHFTPMHQIIKADGTPAQLPLLAAMEAEARAYGPELLATIKAHMLAGLGEHDAETAAQEFALTRAAEAGDLGKLSLSQLGAVAKPVGEALSATAIGRGAHAAFTATRNLAAIGAAIRGARAFGRATKRVVRSRRMRTAMKFLNNPGYEAGKRIGYKIGGRTGMAAGGILGTAGMTSATFALPTALAASDAAAQNTPAISPNAGRSPKAKGFPRNSYRVSAPTIPA